MIMKNDAKQDKAMMKADVKQDKAMIASAVHKHEHNMHPGKGVTKLRKGGVTSAAMKAVGRNMARAMNQRGR
jgi:hypothetical protein